MTALGYNKFLMQQISENKKNQIPEPHVAFEKGGGRLPPFLNVL
jgi:hypothetical protein